MLAQRGGVINQIEVCSLDVWPLELHLTNGLLTRPLPQYAIEVHVFLATDTNTLLSLRARCFRHQLLLPSPYLVLTKPLRLDIQCQRGASVKIGWKYLDN